MLFLHAVTGCDTVSAIHRRDKRKAFSVVHKQKYCSLMDTFSNAESPQKDVKDAGEQFILKLSKSLNEYLFLAYKRAIGRSSLSS